jgi:hypothetical protein
LGRAEPVAVEGPPSLVGTTIRRTILLGRIYLIVGTGESVFFAVLLGFIHGASFASTVPPFLPVFVVVGALGGIIVFTSDRLKGVFEYLIAYGVSPRRLFGNILFASLVLTTIVLGTALAVGLSVYVATGHTISAGLAGVLSLYSVPMS